MPFSNECKYCGNHFLIDPITGRKRQYCNNACKQAAYREKKRNKAVLRYAPPPDALFHQYANDLELHDRLMGIWMSYGEKAAREAAAFGVLVAKKVRRQLKSAIRPSV